MDEQVLTDLQATWEKKLMDANVFPTTHVHTSAMLTNNPLHMANINGSNQVSANGLTVMYANGGSGSIRASQNVRALTASMLAQQQQSINTPGNALLVAQGQVPGMRPQVQSGISYFQDTHSGAHPNAKIQTGPSIDTSNTAPQKTAETIKKPPKKPKSIDNEEELNSDLDSSLSSSSSDPEAPDDLNENIILCLYEKVSRTRNRWRAAFRSGSLHLNGVDYAFNRQNAEFEF